MEAAADIGPIPQGDWTIVGPPFNTPEHGPFVLKLEPSATTNTFGRNGFLIHGDSIQAPGTSSRGSLVFPRSVREEIWSSGNRKLHVVSSATRVNPDGRGAARLRTSNGTANSSQVSVPAKKEWTNTLVEVRKGERITFTAAGQIQWGNGSKARVGPSGSSWKLRARVGRYPVTTMGAGALIGKIGQKGTPFAVGERATITAPANGTLYLGINDNFFTDNAGTFEVTITKE